ncbi:MAG: MG2 domain-containing protein [Bacteroidetes bacterium]|nr:MG2 domain-containing protein [Bacteroidota bacterium]
MKKKLYLTLFLLIPLTIAAGDYTGFIGQLFQYLKHHNHNYPQEKVYVQTDKPFYKPGEYVRYKAFLVNSTDNRASEVSDVLYVELRDPKGNVHRKETRNTQEGVASGFLYIDKNAAGGIYTLVAYTQWQKNWGEEQFFKKEITVQKVITPRLLLRLEFEKRAYGAGDSGEAILSVSDLQNVKTYGSTVKAEVKIAGNTVQTIETTTVKGEARITFQLPADLNTSDGLLQVIVTDNGVEESISRSIPIVMNKIHLQFFPEGGELIENVPSNVAFEALNEFGKGADVSGIIVDENNMKVADFESFHLGMGAFTFTPQAGKSYFAKIEKPQGNHALVALPQASKTGYSLQLQSKDSTAVTWKIHAPEAAKISLVAHTQGVPQYGKEIQLQKGHNTVTVNTEKFPIGIAVFTLFDENKRERCERLLFVNPKNGLKINLSTDKELYRPLETVQLKIRTTDKNNRPVAAAFGVAVVDEQLLALANDKQDGILSYLLFSSELKGNIQEPAFYFNEEEKKAPEAIDYLMLTHGWRRFTWREVLQAHKVEMPAGAERNSDIYGYILNKKGQPAQATIYLTYSDKSSSRRIAELTTTPEGQFAFHNVDLRNGARIYAPYSHSIHLFKGKPFIFKEINFENRQEINFLEENFNPIENKEEKDARKAMTDEEFENWLREQELKFGDMKNVQNVVKIGYSSARPEDVTGGITQLSGSDLSTMPIINAGQLLMGKAAGVQVRANSGVSGEVMDIVVRGRGTVGDARPLYVVNGVPVGNEFRGNPADIDYISILKDPSATAMYGARGANGVILIATKSANEYGYYRRFKQRAYTQMYIPEKRYYGTEVFQYSTRKYGDDKLNTTLYWNADVTTDKNGEATLKFQCNEISSSFCITAEGFSPAEGLIGSATLKFATAKPFSIDVKTPLFAAVGDEVRLPVLVRNNTKEVMTARVNLNFFIYDEYDGYHDARAAKYITPVGEPTAQVTIQPESTQTVFLAFSPKFASDNISYTISANAGSFSDRITRSVTVRSVNFPQSQSFSGQKMNDSFSFQKSNKVVEGSFRAEFVCYATLNEQLFAGLESILREPYGCFEQVSSSNFPNIMALQLMQTSKDIDQKAQSKALNLLDNGYKKLAAYEVPGGGFDWYGRTPASTALTAYGVLQFHEMAKVYDKINDAMTVRARKYLLNMRDGKGNFTQKGVWTPPQAVGNAYVVYALSEVQETEDYSKEYNAALQEAFASEDMYQMALMANAAYNRGDMENYNRLIQHFEKEVNKSNGFNKLKVQTTITWSGGDAQKLETVALWAIALLKSTKDTPIIEECIAFIASKRSAYGGFGNTQSTILSLQALTKYAQEKAKVDLGSLQLAINGQSADLNLRRITKKDVTQFFAEGNNTIQLQFTDMQEPLPYNLRLTWEYKMPPTDAECPFVLTTKLNKTTIKRNETVRLAVTIENKKSEGQPMSVAIIGIPGGMSLQAWQLKEMHEQEVFDFYEIINDNLVLYYRSFNPKERKTVNLDLKAEVPGTYTGMASTAYVYYTNEYKYWVQGLRVRIEE